ncbi:hypothetical protein C8D92_10498 [Tamilnaduibacter salinus]|uniref:Uncharacterized protein n=1 Tax=Tamilnaduibacter salinus TaxID=1484056 RepID=A0A2U1CX78_9GAMM|nr:hypothetical protein [Tamilnaduibacter salinus]PVY76867.1 hypothetical protein C8D92_10498 [Tamilnaduibacter salinus]
MERYFGRSNLASILTALASITLSACGGDDSGDGSSNSIGGESNHTVQTLVPMQLDETASASYSLNRMKASGQAADVAASGNNLDASLADSTVNLRARAVDRPSSATVTIHNSQGQALARFEVAINNTSAQAMITEAETFTNKRDRLLTLAEGKAYYDFTTAKAYMDATITASEYQQLRDSWDISQQPSYSTLDSALTTLANTLADYQNAGVPDSNVEHALETARTALANHDRYADTEFQAANSVIGQTPQQSMGDVSYHEPSESLSRFVGNPSLGKQTNNGWVFDQGQEQFEMLAGMRSEAQCYVGEAK